MDPDVARKIRSPWLWLVPVGAVVVLMSLLAATYVGSVADPQKHLEKFPVLLVNEDDGGRLPAPGGGEGPEQNFGAQIVSGLEKGSDTQKFDLEVVDSDTAFRRLDNAEAYGAIVIPRNFTSTSIEFAGSAVGFTQVDRPVIQVWTNPGAGALASSIVTAYADTALTEANTTFGKQLAAGVIDQAKQAGLTVSGASLLGLAAPIDIRIDPADPLPGNAGNGLTAFYFALLLVLAGFTGSVIVQTLVDGMLGFGPMEVGPLYRLMAPLKISRWGTLVIKWWIMFVIALVLASVYLLVCRVVGMDLSNAFALWMFGVLVITAVGVTCMSVAAALGSFGLLVNMVVFVVLGLPSSGGTVPLEATPSVFHWLAWFEPMHQVYLGTRAILYFDVNFSAGLGRALVMTGVGLVIGLVLGAVVTQLYDRKGWLRAPGGLGPRHLAESSKSVI